MQITASGTAVVAPAMFPAAARAGKAIVLAYSTVPDGWPGGEVKVARSDDEAATWHTLAVFSPHAGEDAVLGAVGLTCLSDGTLLLPLNTVIWGQDRDAASRRLALRLHRSSDGGRSWEDDGVVELDGFARPAVYGQLIERRDGELLWPIWGSMRAGERWRSAILSSRDRGKTWALKGTIAFDPDARLRGSYVDAGAAGLTSDARQVHDPHFRPHDTTDGFSETSVLELPDGRLMAAIRQQGVGGDDALTLYSAWSRDSGATWTHYRPLGFSGTSPLLANAPDGSMLLFSRRHLPQGSAIRPAVEVRQSHDEGVTWHETGVLRDPNGTELTAEYQCGYPAAIAQSDGLLVFFYSFLPGRGRFIAWNRLDFW
jgi:hypothetical protein